MDEVVARLADAWEKFDVPLRMHEGFNEESFVKLKGVLKECSESWATLDSIPRLAVNILVDIFPATEGNADLYEKVISEKIVQMAFELQELVGECVALND